MLQQYILGVGALLVLLAAWIGVQRAWRRAFPGFGDDPDVLAGRSGCHGCSSSLGCQRACEGGDGKIEEERR